MLTAQEAAIGFARRLRPQDLAEVVDFDSRVEVLQGFTNSVPDLERAIRKTAAGGSTSLYNAVYISLKELKKAQVSAPTRSGGQAIILLTDGEDTSSLVTFDEVLELARAVGDRDLRHRVDGVGTEPEQGVPGGELRVCGSSRSETGGRAFFPTDDRGSRLDVRTDLRGAVEPVHDRVHVQEHAPGRRMAPRRGARQPPQRDRPNQGGVLRAGSVSCPTSAREPHARTDHVMNLVPLILYLITGVVYAVHFARRSPAAGRAASMLLVAARPGAHVRHRHADHAGGARAVCGQRRRPSRRSSGCSRCRTCTWR